MTMQQSIHPLSSQPNKLWELLRPRQTVNTVDPETLYHRHQKHPNSTRFVCISDTHSRIGGGRGGGRGGGGEFAVPEGDVLIHAGDFTNTGLPREVEEFSKFLGSQPHPHKIVIAGNHDLTFDEDNYSSLWRRFGHPRQYDSHSVKQLIISAGSGVTYLEDSGTTVNGLFIWGSPWQPEFYNWGFNLPRGEPCLKKWSLIPNEVDVLITHGPPLGHGDLCSSGFRAGCAQLLDTVQQRVRPKYHIFGHIHEGYGVTSDGVTNYINCSTCNLGYQPINSPIVFDIANK